MVAGNVVQISQRGNAFNIKMDDGQWYGFGFDQPNFQQGANITFEVDYNGRYANVRKGSVQVMGGGQPQQQQQQAPQQNYQRKPRNDGGKDQYWKDREKRDLIIQKRIQYQSARKDAIEVVGILAANDVVALPSKKADKMDAMLALIDELTNKFDLDTNLIGKPGAAQGIMSHLAGNEPQQEPQQQQPQDDFDDDIPF